LDIYDGFPLNLHYHPIKYVKGSVFLSQLQTSAIQTIAGLRKLGNSTPFFLRHERLIS